MAQSLKGSETDRETIKQKEQQVPSAPDLPIDAWHHDVVVTVPSEQVLSEELAGIGVTSAVARRLIATFGAAHVRHHLDVHVWECAEHPGRPHLTAGRLRRRIEDDWATPPGYCTPTERALGDAAWEQDALHREERLRQDAAAAAARDREYRERLAVVGLEADDQASWARLAHEAPPLPLLFRQALFYGSRGREPAALIFVAHADAERATSGAHRTSRAAVAARLARAHGRPIAIQYLWYDDVLRLIRDGADAANPPSSTRHGDA